MAHSDPAADRTGTPRQVEISFWLWITSVVIGLLSTVLLFTGSDAMRAAAAEGARAADPDVDPAVVEQAATVGLVVGIVVGLVLVLAQLALALLMRRGRNWARIGLAVLAVLTVLALPLSLPTATGPILAVGVVQALLVVAATVLMFLPGARPWFRKRA